MSVIVHMPPGSEPNFVPTLPPTTCEPWCLDGTGHPHAVHLAEQTCRGVEQKLDTVNGGSTNDDEASVTFASISSRAQKLPGQPPTFLIGIAAGDAESIVELNQAELRMLVQYLGILLGQTTATR